jgi:hypothetical protein
MRFGTRDPLCALALAHFLRENNTLQVALIRAAFSINFDTKFRKMENRDSRVARLMPKF